MDNDIGKLIKQKRKEKKLTLEQVAAKVCVGKSTVSKWERGAIKNMKRDKLEALSQLLDIDPLTLILGLDKSDNEEITPQELKHEIISLLSKVNFLSGKEKAMIINNFEYLCDRCENNFTNIENKEEIE